MSTISPPATTLPVLDDRGRRLLFTDARTANTFTDQPVTDKQLAQIYELTKFGPTSANTSPLRILFTRLGEGRDRLLPFMNEGNRAKTAAAPVTAILANDSAFHERIPELLPFKPELREMFAGAPDLRAETARYNGALQAAYFIFGVRAVGLAAGPMSGFDAAGVDTEFFGGTTWQSHLVVNIGYPGADAWFPRLPRLHHDDAVRYA